MTKYREIIRLASLSLSQTNIALSCGVSKKTVNKVLKAAREKGISWPLDPNQTDSVIEQLLFPKKNSPESQSNRRMPDYAHIRKELLRNGVNKKLLWTEYLEECRLSGDEPLMYSQFCYYIQKDEQKRRATMHINRKPAEQVEVDWAGDCFLQALFPQKCRVTSSKLHGEFPQYCISPSGTLLGAGEEPLQAYKVY